jgi:hypothetical protein
MARYSNGAIYIDTDSGTENVAIGGVVDISAVFNSTLISPDDGNAFPLVQSIASQLPELPFSTANLTDILDNVSITGLCIDSGVGNPGVVAYAEKHDPCASGARASGANHMAATIGNGHLLIESISGGRTQNATARLRAHAISSDGSTAPISFAFNASLPASVLTKQFQAYAPRIAGTEITDATNVSIDFNPSFEKIQYLGFTFPTDWDFSRLAALVTIDFDDPSRLATFGTFDGVSALHTNSELRFLQRKPNGRFLTGSDHITCTIEGLVHVLNPFAASGSGVSTSSMQIALIENSAGTAPMVWTTGVAQGSFLS